jgi:hypothetical protein
MARQTKADLLNFFREQIKEEKPKKTRKPRKPMSEEQKLAAAERLKKAREKRMKENPPEYKNVHPSVLKRSDVDPLNLMAVKNWISINKEKLSEARKDVKKGVKGSVNIASSISSYINIMENYLKTGDWYGMFCGENEDQLVKTHCVAQAYYPDGTAKRTVGVFYPEIGEVWTQEMDEEHRKFLD